MIGSAPISAANTKRRGMPVTKAVAVTTGTPGNLVVTPTFRSNGAPIISWAVQTNINNAGWVLAYNSVVPPEGSITVTLTSGTAAVKVRARARNSLGFGAYVEAPGSYTVP